jgi:hypothetical protein
VECLSEDFGDAPGRLLLLDFIEKREVAACHVLDLLAKRPDVLERTVGRLEPVRRGRHGIGERDERLLDHREPLPDGGGHWVHAFLTNHVSRERQKGGDSKPCGEALTSLRSLKQVRHCRNSLSG